MKTKYFKSRFVPTKRQATPNHHSARWCKSQMFDWFDAKIRDISTTYDEKLWKTEILEGTKKETENCNNKQADAKTGADP